MFEQAGAAPTPWVLMYHSIADVDSDPLNITASPATFEAQLHWLYARGLRGTSLSGLLAASERDARKLVGLTFDDGYADFATTAVPILRRYGFTATVYVLADRLGGSNEWDAGAPEKPLMTKAQVREVADAGMEVGSHGLRHLSLPLLTPRRLAAEVGHSREILGELVGWPVPSFAYPYGHFGDREIDAVRAAGYRHACGVGRARPGTRHAMSRSFVAERDRGARLAAKKVRHLVWGRSR
jgi:peptidoglycan/xylan/chitin deacetylase (PgdA/CDA1 family)